jgi:hypothetical protein
VISGFYEAKPGYWIPQGISWEEHRAAIAGNYTPEDDFTNEDWELFEGEMLRAWRDAVRRYIAAQDDRQLWITRDGEKIFYCDLTPSHLLNIGRLLLRNKKEYLFPNLMQLYYQGGGV